MTDRDEILAALAERADQQYFGKYRGFVKDNADPEQLGRLKVSVPSLFGEEVVTGWAMPCLPYGGAANQGMFFIPEVDAGVWVEFEEGDLAFPIWVGAFWSKPGGESELPKGNAADGAEEEAIADPPTRKIIKTAAGHTLQFEDAADSEMIVLIEGKNGHVVVLDQAGIVVTDGANGHVLAMTEAGIEVTDGVNNHTMVMDASGISLTDGVTAGNQIVTNDAGVSILSDQDIAITCKNLAVNASETIDLTSEGDFSAGGDNLNLTANADLTASGDNIGLDAGTALTGNGGDVTLSGDTGTVEAKSGQLTIKGNPVHLNP